jgi:hypothetical protein
MVPWGFQFAQLNKYAFALDFSSDGILPTRRRPGMPACIWDTGDDAFAGAPGRAKPSPTICAGTPSGVERQQMYHDISKTIRTTGSHVRVPDTRTDRQKIGLGHRHRWLCRAGDRRLALRAVRREHHIRPPSVRRNQKRAQRGRASSIKAPAQGKRSDNAAAWPEVMTTQIIAIRGRPTAEYGTSGCQRADALRRRISRWLVAGHSRPFGTSLVHPVFLLARD